jgi:hypothetical protein
MHGSGSLKWDPWIKFERGLRSSDIMFALSDSIGGLCVGWLWKVCVELVETHCLVPLLADIPRYAIHSIQGKATLAA